MRRVLITGGARRLGAAICRRMAAAGHRVVIHFGRSGADAKTLAAEIGALTIGADLADATSLEPLIRRAAEMAGGPLDGLVNNASVFEHDRADSVSAEALLQHFQVNTLAPVMLARSFAAQAQPDADAVIVNMLDQKLWNLNADHFSYTLSKAALETATGLLARSFAPHLRVLGVAPGYTLPSPGESDATFEAKAAGANLLQRRLYPEDIAQAVQLCFDSRYLTGQTLIAANGEHLVPHGRDIAFRD